MPHTAPGLIEREQIAAARTTITPYIRLRVSSLWSRCRIVAEPGGAAATAALLKRRYQPGPGERIGVVISGGDTVAVDFSRQEKSVADLEPRALRP